jgi:hypothetical protein
MKNLMTRRENTNNPQVLVDGYQTTRTETSRPVSEDIPLPLCYSPWRHVWTEVDCRVHTSTHIRWSIDTDDDVRLSPLFEGLLILFWIRLFFFPPTKSEYFFQQHWESEYFFRKKTHNPPPPFKLNGPSLMFLNYCIYNVPVAWRK